MLNSTPASRREAIVGLDLARFFAAFLVMFFHLAYLSWAMPTSSAAKLSGGGFAFPALTSFSWFGWVGVEIFFLLSGFVISYSAGTNAFAFFRSRVLRLLPGAWASATITALILLAIGYEQSMSLGELYLRTMAFLPIGPWLDGVYWTLSIEITFYALVFGLLVFKRIDRLETLLITIGTASTAFWFGIIALDPNLVEPGSWGWRGAEIALLTDGIFFAIGGLMWMNLCGRPSRRRWAVIAAFVIVALVKIAHQAADDPQVITSPSLSLVPTTLWLAALLLMIAAVRANRWLSGRLNPNAVRALGLATYPLYLLHTTIGGVILFALKGTGIQPLIALGIAIIASILAALATARYLEPPIKRALDYGLTSCERLLGRRSDTHGAERGQTNARPARF